MADLLYRRKIRNVRSVGFYDQLGRQEPRFVASLNNGIPTFEIIIYIGYRSTSLTNLSLSISRAAMEGLGIGAGDGLQRVLPIFLRPR